VRDNVAFLSGQQHSVNIDAFTFGDLWYPWNSCDVGNIKNKWAMTTLIKPPARDISDLASQKEKSEPVLVTVHREHSYANFPVPSFCNFFPFVFLIIIISSHYVFSIRSHFNNREVSVKDRKKITLIRFHHYFYEKRLTKRRWKERKNNAARIFAWIIIYTNNRTDLWINKRHT